jgi:hypothetical protein
LQDFLFISDGEMNIPVLNVEEFFHLRLLPAVMFVTKANSFFTFLFFFVPQG